VTTNQLAWRLIEALRSLTGETSALIGRLRGQLKTLRGRLPNGKLTVKQRRLLVLQLAKSGKWPAYIRDYVTAVMHELRRYTPPRHRKLLDRQTRLGSSLGRRLSSDLKQAIRAADTTLALDSVITHLADRVGKWQALAKRILVTEIVRSANAEVVAGLGDGDKVRWDATLDKRVCRVCAGADGEVREYGEAFSSGVIAPPVHSNCRCLLIRVPSRKRR
jgi:SPP1 gp7 family putative phage head morphogenesis protein